jgi:hypothetical protein
MVLNRNPKIEAASKAVHASAKSMSNRESNIAPPNPPPNTKKQKKEPSIRAKSY